MNRDELHALQMRHLRSLDLGERGAIPGMDLRELPADPETGTWEVWIYAAVPRRFDADATPETYAAVLAEIDRRERLVRFAQALIDAERHYAKATAPERDEAHLAARIAAERADAAVRSQARTAMDAIERHAPKIRKRMSIFTLRCPQNCALADVYPCPPHEHEIGRESMLVVAHGHHGQRTCGWLASSPGQQWTPPYLAIGCLHGSGKIPTGFPHFVDRSQKITRRNVDVPSVSWSPARRPTAML